MYSETFSILGKETVSYSFLGGGGAGVWTQGFKPMRQVPYFLIYTSSLLCYGYFGDKILIFAKVNLDCGAPILCFPLMAKMTGMHYYAQLFPIEMGSHKLLISASLIAWDDRCASLCQAIGWVGVLWPFCLGHKILPISASQVARITGMSHWCQALTCSSLKSLAEYHIFSRFR
jgi:hypothetical protein